MRKSVIYILFLPFFIGCNGSNNKEVSKIPGDEKHSEGKSRLEQVSEVPYRNGVASEETRTLITGKVKELILQLESFKDVKLYYLVNNNIEEEEGNWDNARSAIEHSYHLWKTHDIQMTIVSYPSISSNTQTDEITELHVFEVEYKNLTGTCRLFINVNNPDNFERFSYSDRR